MLKTYSTPALVVKGNVVEVTKTSRIGKHDLIDPPFVLLMPVGSVGFQL